MKNIKTDKGQKNSEVVLNLLSEISSNAYISFDNCEILKTKRDFSIAYLCFFIFKAISDQDPFKFSKANNLDRRELGLVNESDHVINKIVDTYLLYLITWINFKFFRNFFINRKTARLGVYCFVEELCNLSECYLKSEKLPFTGSAKHYFLTVDYDFSYNFLSSHIPYKWAETLDNKIFIYSYHFSTIIFILKENPKSAKFLEISDIFWNSLQNTLNNSLYVCNVRLSKIIDDLCLEHKVDRAGVRNSYKVFWNEIKNEMRNRDKSWCETIVKEAAILLKIINLLRILENNNGSKIFLPPMYCFRGRTYFLSSYSITFQKELRYCSHWGSDVVSNNCDLPQKELELKIENLLAKRFHKLKALNDYNFAIKNAEIKSSIIWILVSIAENFKSKKPSWTLDDFIDEGVDTVNNWSLVKSDHNLEKRLKIDYCIHILSDIDNGNPRKWLIPKDATGSVFQHSIKSVGIRDERSLKWCNFNSEDTWYDTYSFITDEWLGAELLENHGKHEKFLKKIFKRKYTKATIMTHLYGAKLNPSKKRFFTDVNEDFPNLTQEDVNLLNIKFTNFFSFLENSSLLISISSKQIKDQLLKIKDGKIRYKDDVTIDTNYYESRVEQIEAKKNGKRFVRQNRVLLQKKDVRKIADSIRANYVQGLDASLVRWFYARGYKGITIHDCFMVDYLSVTKLLAIINLGMRENFHNLKDPNFDLTQIFSPFILL